MQNHRYSYNHPVFWSRKHPFHAKPLDIQLRLALLDHLSDTEAPF
jgi:hypothetical protein